MQTYASALELARICARQAHFTKDRGVAAELWRMAVEYQKSAAKLDGGKLPDIGPAPVWLKQAASGE